MALATMGEAITRASNTLVIKQVAPTSIEGPKATTKDTRARMEALLAHQAAETTTVTPTRRLTNLSYTTSATTSRIANPHTTTWKFSAGSSMMPSTALPMPPDHHPSPIPPDFILSWQVYELSDGLQVSRSSGWIHMMAKPIPSSS